MKITVFDSEGEEVFESVVVLKSSISSIFDVLKLFSDDLIPGEYLVLCEVSIEKGSGVNSGKRAGIRIPVQIT